MQVKGSAILAYLRKIEHVSTSSEDGGVPLPEMRVWGDAVMHWIWLVESVLPGAQAKEKFSNMVKRCRGRRQSREISSFLRLIIIKSVFYEPWQKPPPKKQKEVAKTQVTILRAGGRPSRAGKKTCREGEKTSSAEHLLREQQSDFLPPNHRP